MENILFTICARAGSKGLSGKNVKCLNDIPLLYYTLASYNLFKKKYKEKYGIISLAVNTDSDILKEQMDNSDIQYFFVPRTDELAGDIVSKISVIRDTLIKIEQDVGKIYSIVVDLDLTSPLRNIEDIEGTVKTVLLDEDADISFSVTEARRSPHFNMVSQNESGYYDRVISTDYVSRQQTPECFDMNASIYAYKKEYLLSNRDNQRNALIWKMKDTAVLDIDCEEDFEILGLIAPHWSEKNKGFNNVVQTAKDIVRRIK